jgi:catechol 2,3-dioxygenase-like lactoylglutathione lyase family enzyme
MISGLSHATVYVLDQDKAKDFYTQQLGFELRSDQTMEGFRWLTVGPKGAPDVHLVLIEPAPPMFDPETAEQFRALIAKGVIGPGVMRTDDCRATFNELSAKGVTFLQEPTERPYGVEAVFRDNSGNWYSLTEPPR